MNFFPSFRVEAHDLRDVEQLREYLRREHPNIPVGDIYPLELQSPERLQAFVWDNEQSFGALPLVFVVEARNEARGPWVSASVHSELLRLMPESGFWFSPDKAVPVLDIYLNEIRTAFCKVRRPK